jgi:hypothetical protein
MFDQPIAALMARQSSHRNLTEARREAHGARRTAARVLHVTAVRLDPGVHAAR